MSTEETRSAATGLTLAEIYADDEYVLRGDGGGGFEVSYPRSHKTPHRVIGRIRKGEFFPASEWREPTGRDRGQAGRDDVDFLTGKRTAPDPPAASGHGTDCSCIPCEGFRQACEETPVSKPRIKASTARLMLAREMWARYHDVDGCSAWDEDSLPTHVYERWIERADDVIREAMARGD